MLIAAGACGSSKKSSNGNTSSSGSKPTGTPILIGSLIEDSGPVVSNAGDQAKLVSSVWLKYVNNHGGINGHPVQLIIDDDGGSASVAAQDVQDMINRGVVAMVAIQSPLRNFLTSLAQANVPIIGGELSASYYETIPNDFVVGAVGSRVGVVSDLTAAKLEGAKSVGVMVCAEVAACAQAADPFKAVAPTLGLKFGGVQTVSASAPDYSAQCLAMKQAGVDTVDLFLAGPTAVRVAGNCATQGYNPHWVDPVADASLPSVPAFNGLVSADYLSPWFLNDTPGQKLFQQVVGSQISDHSAGSKLYGEDAVTQWASYRIFQLAATTATTGGAQLTRASLAAALKAMPQSETTLDGLAGPDDYTLPNTQQGDCFYIIGINNGQWTTPEGTGYKCIPAASS